MVLNTKPPLIVCGTTLTDELLTSPFILLYTVLRCIGYRRFTVFRRTPLYCHYFSRTS